ncbi:MAG: hypothetical protein FWG55_05955 [Candidatus Bathyarchaeota archaeon]|nr:hypothetical protein [Candidatus Termiticorpusculum sp.]
MKKLFSVFLFTLLVSGLFFASIICMDEVEATSKPSVPDFTVRYNEYPYDIPDTQYVDTYTGETITIPGYHLVNRTIEIVIKNPRGSSDLCYNVRYKGHYGTSDDAWQEIFLRSEIDCGLKGGFPAQPGSEYTILSFPNGELPRYIGEGMRGDGRISGIDVPAGAKMDFQVEAMAVGIKHVYSPITYDVLLAAERSGWSGTKTLTIPAYNNEAPNQTNPTPTPTHVSDQTDSQTETAIAGFSLLEFSLVIILCTTLPVLIIALIYTRRRVLIKE